MGLSRALFSGISGLKGHSVKLDVIGNNIANVNTVGFKKSRVTFSDLFYDTVSEGSSPSDRVGGQNPKQVGLGAGTPVIEQIMTEGASQTTGVGTDLAIAGEGFFVVGDSFSNFYTRDGNFKLDQTGDMVAAGSTLRVKGYMADRGPDGGFVIDPSGTLEVINLQENRKMYASATNHIEYGSNLNSGSAAREIAQADTFFAYKDDSSVNPELQGQQRVNFSFQKIDGTTYTWSANDTAGKSIASGELKFSDFGEIISSTVKGAGSTKVNYDFTDPRFVDILTQNAFGDVIGEEDVPPTGIYSNRADGVADLIFDPESEDFRRLSDRLKPRAFSFTYDPDGDFVPGRWDDPNGIKSLRGDAPAGSINRISIAGALAPQANGIVLDSLNFNNSYDRAQMNPSQVIDENTADSVRISITAGAPDPSGNATVNAQVWTIPPGGNVGAAVLLGTAYGLDAASRELSISVPGRVNMRLTNNNVGNWTTGQVSFGPRNSGSLTRSNGADFNLSNAAFNTGNNVFEIRYIDSSKSEYSGDLRLQFTGVSTFQVLDDANQVLTTGTLRDGEVDTLVEAKGITLSIHRQGSSLVPLDVSDQGYDGTTIRIRGFRAATGTAGPVTVNIPKPSELSSTGAIVTPQSQINYNMGFSNVAPDGRLAMPASSMAASFVDPLALTPAEQARLDAINAYRASNLPAGTVTVDATMARSGSAGSYKVEFGLKDPAVSHLNPNNQVLKVYLNGVETYVVDLNPIVDDGNNTTPQFTDANGTERTNADYAPQYNFFAEMELLQPGFNPLGAAPAFVAGGTASVPNAPGQSAAQLIEAANTRVNRQINLPNGVVINLSNVDVSGNIGRDAASAHSGSANFMIGDSYTFDVPKEGQSGIRDIGTYSAAFQRGAEHSTSIEVYDSLGGAHVLRATYEHVDKNKREWNYYITLDSKDPLIQDFLKSPPPGFQVRDPKNPTDVELRQANDYILKEGRQGKIIFREDGTIDTINSSIPRVVFKPADATQMQINLDMNAVTQFESEFGTAARFRNGNQMGLMQGFSIGANGEIVGSFSNGLKATVAQLAMASFNNPDGLVKRGNNLYDVSANSGIARVGIAGSDDRGLIKAGVLENSNVDLTEEFTELIITQRAFSANGRIITTSDEFLQEILSLKR